MIEWGWGSAAGVAGLLGLLVFVIACCYHRVVPPIEKPCEALGFGGLVPLGIHVIYGAFNAHALCHLVDDNGKAIETVGSHLTFSDHTWEIVAGGVGIVLTALYSL